MSQRDEARAAVVKLIANARDRAALVSLHDALGKAQNDPPDGESDGTIGEALWTRLRDIGTAFNTIQRELDAIAVMTAGRK